MVNNIKEILQHFGRNSVESIHLKDAGISIYFREETYTELKDYHKAMGIVQEAWRNDFNFLKNNFRELRPVSIRNKETGVTLNNIVLIAADEYTESLICTDNKGEKIHIPLSQLEENEWEWIREE